MDSRISIIMNEELLQKLHYVTEKLFYPIGTNITTNNFVFFTLHRTLLSYIHANPQHKGRTPERFQKVSNSPAKWIQDRAETQD